MSAWASDQYVTITEGWGGSYPNGMQFSPRNWNGAIEYGFPGLSHTLIYGQLEILQKISLA